MLDFSFSELLLIIVVAVVCLGPKELPVAVRAVAKLFGQVKEFSSDVRGTLRTLAQEAGVEEMKQGVRKITIGDDGKPYEAYDLDAFLTTAPTIHAPAPTLPDHAHPHAEALEAPPAKDSHD